MPLLKHSIFNRHGQKLCRFFMPFSLSETFGKKSPDFQTVNLAQKKGAAELLQRHCAEKTAILFGEEGFKCLKCHIKIYLAYNLIRSVH